MTPDKPPGKGFVGHNTHLQTKRQKTEMEHNNVKEEKRRAWKQKMRSEEIKQILVTGRSLAERYGRTSLSRKASNSSLIDSGSDTD